MIITVLTVILLAAAISRIVSASSMLPTGLEAARSIEDALSGVTEALTPVLQVDGKRAGFHWPPLKPAHEAKGKVRGLLWPPRGDGSVAKHLTPPEGNKLASPPRSQQVPVVATPPELGTHHGRLHRATELTPLRIPPRESPLESTAPGSSSVEYIPPGPSTTPPKTHPARSKLSPDAEPFVLSLPRGNLSPTAEPFVVPPEQHAALVSLDVRRSKAVLGPSKPFSLLRRGGETRTAKTPSALQASSHLSPDEEQPQGPSRALPNELGNVNKLNPRSGLQHTAAGRMIERSQRKSNRREVNLPKSKMLGPSRFGREPEGQWIERGRGTLEGKAAEDTKPSRETKSSPEKSKQAESFERPSSIVFRSKRGQVAKERSSGALSSGREVRRPLDSAHTNKGAVRTSLEPAEVSKGQTWVIKSREPSKSLQRTSRLTSWLQRQATRRAREE